MKNLISVHIFQGDKKFVAECVDLPVVTQGDTLDELARNIKEAIELHLETENLEELDIAPNPAIIANIEINSLSYA